MFVGGQVQLGGGVRGWKSRLKLRRGRPSGGLKPLTRASKHHRAATPIDCGQKQASGEEMTLKGLTQEGPLQKRTVGNSKKKGAQMLTETPHSIGQRIGSEPGTTRHDSPVALHSVATQDGSTTPYAVLVK